MKLLNIITFLSISTLFIFPSKYAGIPPEIAEAQQETAVAEPHAELNTIYLPIIKIEELRVTMTGLYTSKFFNDEGVIQSLVAADQFAGKKHSIGALFWAMEDPPSYNLLVQLNTLWNYGYTPFINLVSNEPCKPNDVNNRNVMQKFANGSKDAAIRQTAQAYQSFLNNGDNRKAFIGLFPEMNGNWTCYYAPPIVFQTAYNRIRQIFIQEGVALSDVWWVFVPNGYSNPGSEFENYYPGDQNVDIVAFSAYNFGYCPNAAWKIWTEPDTLFDSLISRMRIMAPTKPIIIAQTATTAYYSNGINHSLKNKWLVDAYTLLASRYGVIGVLYFDIRDGSCDLPVYYGALSNYYGYGQGIANIQYGYISPEELSQKNLVVEP
jgi:hypothetical protein